VPVLTTSLQFGTVSILSAAIAAAIAGAAAQDAAWPAYGGDAGGERSSTLDQIRRENVASLEIAWT
jgi:glucose dehydrogenase